MKRLISVIIICLLLVPTIVYAAPNQPTGLTIVTPKPNDEINSIEIAYARIYGDTRYETSYEIANALKHELGINKFKHIIIADGTKFADALSGSYLAAKLNAPILLTDNNHLNDTADYVLANIKWNGTVYLLGGESAIPNTMENLLSKTTVKRLSGDTRYDTNLAILKEAGIDEHEILITTGTNFPDALSASATGKPIMIVNNELTDAQRELLKTSAGKFVIIGGTAVVNKTIENELRSMGHVIRLAGDTRYETTTRIADHFFKYPKEMVIAYAKNFPDGICGGPLAYAKGVPMIITATNMETAADEYGDVYNITTGIIIGGPTLISDESATIILNGTHDHILVEKTVPPTCETDGYTAYTCACGHGYSNNPTKAIGHNWSNWTTSKIPTETTNGEEIRKCTNDNCSATETRDTDIITDKFTTANDTVYTAAKIPVQIGPGNNYETIGELKYGSEITRIGIGNNGWDKIKYNDKTAYVQHNFLTKTKPNTLIAETTDWPKTYADETGTITIYKEWFADSNGDGAWCYAAHLEFTDYTRFGVAYANGKYNSGGETTSAAGNRLNAILCINGDYATPGNGAGGYAIARGGVVCNDRANYCEGMYNSNTGLLTYRTHDGCSGKLLSTLVAEGKLTDTFQFGPAFLLNGSITCGTGGGRAQRTFIGTNGNPGDIWIVVSDGRYNDGKSAGLTGYQCAAYLLSKGCTFGVPLDGGGSSTIWFDGEVLNAARNGQRAVADFVYFK